MYVVQVVNRGIYVNRARLTIRVENASKYSHPSAARVAMARAMAKWVGVAFKVVKL